MLFGWLTNWFHDTAVEGYTPTAVLHDKGIGTRLIRVAEQTALRRSKARIGISVEESPDYAVADQLYRKLGYVPDGNGVTPHDNELHLIKQVESQTD